MEISKKISGRKTIFIKTKEDLDAVKKTQWAKECWDFTSFHQYHVFKNSNLPSENFQNCWANNVDFIKSKLVKTKFHNAKLIGAIFTLTDCSEANFSWANCRGTDFRNSILYKTCFYKAELFRADVRDADCNKTIFTSADLRELVYNEGTNFKGAYYNNSTLFDDDFNPKAKGMINLEDPKEGLRGSD